MSNNIAIGSHAWYNDNIAVGSQSLINNIPIGYNALAYVTERSGNIAIGYNTLQYSKIIILTSKVISDSTVLQYCNPSDQTISYIMYDTNTSKCFHAICSYDGFVSDSWHSNSRLKEAADHYNKIIYPRWMTLFLCIKSYLGDVSHDILCNIMSNYIYQ